VPSHDIEIGKVLVSQISDVSGDDGGPAIETTIDDGTSGGRKGEGSTRSMRERASSWLQQQSSSGGDESSGIFPAGAAMAGEPGDVESNDNNAGGADALPIDGAGTVKTTNGEGAGAAVEGTSDIPQSPSWSIDSTKGSHSSWVRTKQDQDTRMFYIIISTFIVLGVVGAVVAAAITRGAR